MDKCVNTIDTEKYKCKFCRECSYFKPLLNNETLYCAGVPYDKIYYMICEKYFFCKDIQDMIEMKLAAEKAGVE